ncbi:hypothetical protein HRR83_001041 [Exophiala dermatitidis]|uniref:Uncharacterized protein n=2 Tax=Exophiala dermatitidis TaxID=5970 RepID=H6C7I7_EXODN|nr:uncharacterized protein HMPREF1120_07669 [Exophiala dermatitidis NIH/UT8656]KAJ4522558.1 hypothetical protein HRR75_000952 [Exophiala dermatitidis]EHY59686.1 hypothetical protein HMPREF1120_07669 [Exophiala dermatitidis NIH/UT8656]KAJ4525852.1 hypothetical protein HRR74_001045 [Exophiala dermatitidis]KAJ4527203.1 hypothetical protein HRR73_002000 [Exophiala dermatitidis]KAJ4532927.1 hypothetical protein HRR76_007901 [Exophiala dermatitidis]
MTTTPEMAERERVEQEQQQRPTSADAAMGHPVPIPPVATPQTNKNHASNATRPAPIPNKRYSSCRVPVIPLANLKRGGSGTGSDSKIQRLELGELDRGLEGPGSLAPPSPSPPHPPPPAAATAATPSPPIPNHNKGTKATEDQGQAAAPEHDAWSLDSWDPNYREKEYTVSCGRCVVM